MNVQSLKRSYCLRCPYLSLDVTPAECVLGEEPPECSFNGEADKYAWGNVEGE